MTTYDNNFKVKNGLDVATTATVGSDLNVNGSISLNGNFNGEVPFTAQNSNSGSNATTALSIKAKDTSNTQHGVSVKVFPNGVVPGVTPALNAISNISGDTVPLIIGGGSHPVGFYTGLAGTGVTDAEFDPTYGLSINVPTTVTNTLNVTTLEFADGSTVTTGNGFRGYTGSAGSNGYTGSAGTNGYTGSQGSQGTMGLQGYTGSKGDTGSQGTTGFTGSKGDQGVTGYTGSKGDQGITGYTGSQGIIGYSGSKGDQGNAGYTGSQGIAGNSDKYASEGSGSFTLGSSSGTIDVDTGLSWTVGQTAVVAYDVSNLAYVTVTSYDSSNGQFSFNVNRTIGSGSYSTWTVNLDGAVGVLGYTGSQGSQGTTGYTGSSGTNGYTGSQGQSGYTGSQGTQGVSGYTGSASTVAGPAGYTGSAGSYNQSLNTSDSPSFVEVTLGGSTSNTVYPLFTGDGITYTSYYLSGISGTSTQNLDTFNSSTYVSAKYYIQVVDSGNIYFTELLVTQNGTNVYETEYGQLNNNGVLGSFQAILNSGNCVLQFTPTGASNMTIRVAKILFAL
jgi:Collagen triple helix repeat (20 copies)